MARVEKHFYSCFLRPVVADRLFVAPDGVPTKPLHTRPFPQYSIELPENLPCLPHLPQHRLPPLFRIPSQSDLAPILLHTMQESLAQTRLRANIDPRPFLNPKVKRPQQFRNPDK